MAGDEESSLESTPSWAVAAVCSILIVIALLIEHALHLLTTFVKKRKRKSLIQAICQIKTELRNFGFMSLLLTVAEQPISKICIPRRFADSLLPCNDAPLLSADADALDNTCKSEGNVALVSTVGMEQLQMLIIVLAIFHVLSCLVTLGLGEVKMKRWKSWEEETRTLDHQLSHDPRRFKLARQTSFGNRHLKYWSNQQFLQCLVCFLRQFTDSISKPDYFALRHGFIKVHLAKDTEFDFLRYLQRSLDQDLLMVVRISPWIWLYIVIFIFFNAHGFYNHYWLPFIPLVMLLAIGTKLETIINKMCSKSSRGVVVVPGVICITPNNGYFWFKKPPLLLYVMQFILVQNSFQLSFFIWSWYKFGLRSCFHREVEDIVLSLGISILIQFLCAYVTLPLYALVTQMGSSVKKTVFTKRVVDGLKNWHNSAKRNLATRKVPVSPSPLLQPLPSWRSEASTSSATTSRASQFKYPSGRLELLEIQRVVKEIMDGGTNTSRNDYEASFRMWRSQRVNSQEGTNK